MIRRSILIVVLFALFAVRSFGLDAPPPGTHAIVVPEAADRTSRLGSKVHLPAGDYLPLYGSKAGIYYLAPDAVVTRVLWVTKHLRGGLFIPNDPKAGPEYWAEIELGPTRYPLSAPVAYSISEKPDVPPVPRFMPRPNYPSKLFIADVTGSATIDFDVTAKGDVENARVTSATRPEFGEAAKEAIGKAKFSPATHDGKPVPVHMQMPIYFEQKDVSWR